MKKDKIKNSRVISTKYISFVLGAFGLLMMIGGFSWVTGDIPGFYTEGLSGANRILNSLTGVVLTSIALVTPLTSNLYSPQLVRLYLSHPLIITGLSVLVFGQSTVLGSLLLGSGHPFYPAMTMLSVITVFFVLAGVMPYLWFVSHFLRPSYFMPLLTNRATTMMARVHKSDNNPEQYQAVFETVDVVANIALTGMRRGDRRLVLLSIRSLHHLLVEFLTIFKDGRENLNQIRPLFVSGLVREGQEYLKEHQIWPEAYILAHLVEIMEQTDRRQHQLLAEMAELLVESSGLAVEQGRDDLIELHILVFNALMRMAVDEKDVRKFQNLCYHYRLLVEKLTWMPAWMEEVVKHMIHYGKMANKRNMRGALETVLYDLGELALSLSRVDEHLATDFVENHAAPAWFEAINLGEHLKTVAWRATIRVYWESVVIDNRYLSELIRENYLHDDQSHKRYIEKMITNNRPLHWEFNDRLLRMAYLSPSAESLAWEFVSNQEDEAVLPDTSLMDNDGI